MSSAPACSPSSPKESPMPRSDTSICGMLSRYRRESASSLRYSSPRTWRMGNLSVCGWKVHTTKLLKPPAISWVLRTYSRCSMISSGVSTLPKTMFALPGSPFLWQAASVSHHTCAGSFFGLNIWRIRSERISAPAPGTELSPAALKMSSSSSREILLKTAMRTSSTGENPRTFMPISCVSIFRMSV